MIKLTRFLDRYKAKSVTNVVSLKGGKWHIPDSHYSEFLNLYFIAATTSQEPLYLAEKKTSNDDLSYMCADIDITLSELDKCYKSKIPDNFMNNIVDAFTSVIMECIVADSQMVAPIITCRLKEPYKCHFNWPKIVVNNKIGQMIHYLVLERLRLNDKEKTGNWDKWIDGNCYNSTGLRLLGTLKPEETDLVNRYFVYFTTTWIAYYPSTRLDNVIYVMFLILTTY